MYWAWGQQGFFPYGTLQNGVAKQIKNREVQLTASYTTDQIVNGLAMAAQQQAGQYPENQVQSSFL